MTFPYALLRPLLFRLDAERAHHLVAGLLRGLSRHPDALAATYRHHHVADPRLAVAAGPLQLAVPLGLAAGFDKGDGLAAPLFALGFGAVEVGTITPRPQQGNTRPRLFRLANHQALINRMGFNNPGAVVTAQRYRGLTFRPGLLGINLGKNKDTPAERAGEDYLAVLTALADLADYAVVNVSSPNTPGLRDLQAPAALTRILRPLCALTRQRGGPPLLLKLAPDLADADIDHLSDLAVEHQLAGLVLANTTIGRAAVARDPRSRQVGGLSGAPLLPRTTWLVSRIWRRHGARLPIAAAGGIHDAATAWAAIAAGATWVQAYTGLVYGGPSFARDLHRGLLTRLERERIPDLGALRGRDAARAVAVAPMALQ